MLADSRRDGFTQEVAQQQPAFVKTATILSSSHETDDVGCIFKRPIRQCGARPTTAGGWSARVAFHGTTAMRMTNWHTKETELGPGLAARTAGTSSTWLPAKS